jgi:hypothetical protein
MNSAYPSIEESMIQLSDLTLGPAHEFINFLRTLERLTLKRARTLMGKYLLERVGIRRPQMMKALLASAKQGCPYRV